MREWPDDLLAGETAVLTGGGTGIGRQMALRLASLGANVVVASRNPAHHDVVRIIQSKGGRALGVPMDVRQSSDAERTLAAALDEFGAVHHLVNNAAGNFLCQAERLSDNGWRSVVNIVLDGTFFMSRTFGRHWIECQQTGTITNIVTTAAFTAGPYTAHNASAKAGVLALTRSLAVEWGQYGIRVNAIAPGPVDDTEAGRRLWPDADSKARVRQSVPLGRLGEPAEVVDAAIFLASPFARYITAECLVVDGGRWLGGYGYGPPQA